MGEDNLARRRGKRIGLWICLGAVAAAALFLFGLLQGSYWALAVPVALAVLAALSLVFWIGYTINTIEIIPAEAEQFRGEGPRRIAAGICVASVVLAILFLAGVVGGSYLALAIPVTAAVLGFLGMIFWIGWAIVTQKTTLPGSGDEGQAAGDPAP